MESCNRRVITETIRVTVELDGPGTDGGRWFIAFYPSLCAAPVNELEIIAKRLTQGCDTDTPQASSLLKKLESEIIEVLPLAIDFDILPADM